jgi:putative PIG3 family NAD(P)H quinone oxidoreductase
LRAVRAIVVREPGGPEVLEWAEVPDPEAGPTEVVLDVAATAVNRADVLQRQGRYPPPPGAPQYLGLECAGVVRSVGAEVTGWSVGDTACALLAGGGYAEQVAVPAGQLMPVPAGLDLVAAATLPEAACTVWSNLVTVGVLRAGQTVLVHGGASGIGTIAIQVAVALGARVAVTAGSAAKLDRCRELGAEILVNYREQEFVGAVREQTDARGVDLVLDVMGGSYLPRNLQVVAPDGTIVVIGLQGGATAELSLGLLLAKRARVVGTTLRARPTEQKAAIVQDVVAQVWPLVAAGTVRPVVDRVLPLPQVSQAHRALEAGEHVGKIALTVPRQVQESSRA